MLFLKEWFDSFNFSLFKIAPHPKWCKRSRSGQHFDATTISMLPLKESSEVRRPTPPKPKEFIHVKKSMLLPLKESSKVRRPTPPKPKEFKDDTKSMFAAA